MKTTQSGFEEFLRDEFTTLGGNNSTLVMIFINSDNKV